MFAPPRQVVFPSNFPRTSTQDNNTKREGARKRGYAYSWRKRVSRILELTALVKGGGRDGRCCNCILFRNETLVDDLCD